MERLLKADRAHAVAIRAAHEFNNDLTVILNSVSTSLRILGLDHPARADLLELQRAALRCAWTASGLLNFGARRSPDELTELGHGGG